MSRFNSNVYAKLFPRETAKVEEVETSVETFTPTKDIEEKQVDDVESKTEEVDGKEIVDGEPCEPNNEQ